MTTTVNHRKTNGHVIRYTKTLASLLALYIVENWQEDNKFIHVLIYIYIVYEYHRYRSSNESAPISCNGAITWTERSCQSIQTTGSRHKFYYTTSFAINILHKAAASHDKESYTQRSQ